MPSVSKKQHNLMAAVAKNPAFAKKAGIPQRVGADFLKADVGRKFAKGGDMKESKEMMKKEVAFMKKKKAPPFMIEHEMKEVKGKKKPAKFAKGGGCEMKGKTKAFAGGGSSMGAPAPTKYSRPVPTGTSYSPTRPGQQVPTKFGPSRGPVDPMSGMLKGLKPSPEQVKAGAMGQARKAEAGAPTPVAFNRAAPRSLGMKKGGAVKTFAKGGGCELKGKTKGRII